MLLCIVALCVAGVASAQTVPTPPCPTGESSAGFEYRAFAQRSWYAPLVASPRDAQSEVLLWGRSRRFPYMPQDGHVTIWDVSFGKELAIAAWEKGGAGAVDMACGGWGFGLWAPLSFHMIDNMGEESSPIINHDYRLAIAFKVAYGVTARDVVSAKVQLGHESTHLGDEFAIRALAEYGDAFQRINVSYEYFEVGVNWEHRFGRGLQHGVSWRASGVRATAFGGDPGWYSPELIDGTVIQPSAVNVEPAVGIEYMPRGARGWRPFASYEGRLRTVYDYAKASANQREDRQFSSSLVVGLRNLGWAGHGAPDFIVKGYYGVNPNGQFRSQANHWMWGLGLLLRL